MLFVLFWLLPSHSSADDFLGVPVVPHHGQTVLKTDARLVLQTDLSNAEVVKFYKKALEGYKDIKFREWKDSTYIEDDGSLAWHSITISKGDDKGATVAIMKDSWTWIIGTLVLRYIGVFVVLMVLLLGMTVSGKIISFSVKKMEAKNRAG